MGPCGSARRRRTSRLDQLPNLTTDHLVGLAAFDDFRYVPIATLVTEYIAFAVRSDSGLRSGADLLDRLAADPGGVTVALSTALGNPNHIALAKLTRHAGGDINAPHIRVFDTALDAVADVVDGNADVGAVTAASVLKALEAGKVRLLAVLAPQRLATPFAGTPTWIKQSVDCWAPGAAPPVRLESTGRSSRSGSSCLRASSAMPDGRLCWRDIADPPCF